MRTALPPEDLGAAAAVAVAGAAAEDAFLMVRAAFAGRAEVAFLVAMVDIS